MDIEIDKLADEVTKCVKEYNEQVEQKVAAAQKQAAKQASDELKSTSPKQPGSGKYAASWRVKQEKESEYLTNYVVHNQRYWQLTHLLEYGHAKVNGGRTKACVHIKPAQEKANNLLEKLITKELK